MDKPQFCLGAYYSSLVRGTYIHLHAIEAQRRMMLFHFSENDAIAAFTPRPVAMPSSRRAGEEWLNGPLVWAIDDWHQPMYLFPRQCPRVLIWATHETRHEDRRRWFGESPARMIAFIEHDWVSKHRTAGIWRYELPRQSFENLHDAGMWVSRETVVPLAREQIVDLPGALAAAGVELRPVHALDFVEALRKTTLHVSSIRMRNAGQRDRVNS